MHHALGDPLVVEMEDLFPEVEVFQQGRAAHAGLQRILVVGNRTALGGGHDRDGAAGGMVQLTARPAAQPLVMDLGGAPGGFRSGLLRRLGHGNSWSEGWAWGWALRRRDLRGPNAFANRSRGRTFPAAP